DGVELPSEDHEDLRHRLARLADDLALREPAATPVRLDAGELRWRQLRKSLVGPRLGLELGGHGDCRGGHGIPSRKNVATLARLRCSSRPAPRGCAPGSPSIVGASLIRNTR